MNKFLIQIGLFLLSIILIFIAVEMFLRIYPNTFNSKAKYFRQNKEVIEVLFLGSSHTQDGINPRYIEFKSSNLGYGGQDFEIDSALITHYIQEMPKLKKVVWEIDFISLYKKREEDYFRYPWYKIYYGIDFGKNTFINSISLYSTSPDFFNQYLRGILFEKNQVNKYGYNEAEDKGKFSRMNYDEISILKESLNKKNKIEENVINQNNIRRNLRLYESVKKLCIKKNVELVIINYPMYKTYIDQIEDTPMYNYWKSFLKKETELGIEIWDFEKNKNFQVTDFSNDSHLNKNGAKKLSNIINSYL